MHTYRDTHSRTDIHSHLHIDRRTRAHTHTTEQEISVHLIQPHCEVRETPHPAELGWKVFIRPVSMAPIPIFIYLNRTALIEAFSFYIHPRMLSICSYVHNYSLNMLLCTQVYNQAIA